MSFLSDRKQWPMLATYARIVMAPIILFLVWTAQPWSNTVGAILFIVASLTDWLDGYWARIYNSESAMGKFMDPIADKLLVLAPIIVLLDHKLVDSFMVFLIIGRDVFIGGLRSVAAANKVIIAAKPFGKWKTALQMVCIPCLLLARDLPQWPLEKIGYYGLWLSVALSLISGAEYTRGYFRGRSAV